MKSVFIANINIVIKRISETKYVVKPQNSNGDYEESSSYQRVLYGKAKGVTIAGETEIVVSTGGGIVSQLYSNIIKGKLYFVFHLHSTYGHLLFR